MALRAVDEPQDWQDFALCREVGDPELWYVPKGGDGSPAKAICNRCPSREACLDYAVAFEDEHDLLWFASGIWGGLTARERRPLIAARREERQQREAEAA